MTIEIRLDPKVKQSFEALRAKLPAKEDLQGDLPKVSPLAKGIGMVGAYPSNLANLDELVYHAKMEQLNAEFNRAYRFVTAQDMLDMARAVANFLEAVDNGNNHDQNR